MSRTPEDIAGLFAYGRWATAQTLASAAPLTADEFIRPIGGSFGSVQGTFTHIYGADWVWLERWHGRSPGALPTSDASPTLAALVEKWSKVHDGQQAFVASISSARMLEPLTYVNFAGKTLTYPLGETLVHAANHATYHRGQIATLLRQLGKTPVSTDYLRYLDTLARGAADLPLAAHQPVRSGANPFEDWIGSLPEDLDLRGLETAVEKALVRRALDRTNGVAARAARKLGLSRSDLAYKLRRLGIAKQDV